ncbi:hypothetical protein GY45DRAFT_1067139 [Cubamyces sp. BRFM 1775]|nr:hypothetical protein GY45DRAFT_1067139 [Cubamyces sp. BRFM 1775]
MQSPDISKECEDLVAQIAALHTGSSTPTRNVPIPLSVSSPRTALTTAKRPSIPPASSRRYGYEMTPLAPIIRTRELPPLSDPAMSVLAGEVPSRPSREELQSIDAQRAQVESPTSEAAFEDNPFSLPPLSAAPARTTREESEKKSRKRLRDGETREAAKTDDSSWMIVRIKPPTPRPSLSLSERLTLAIAPDCRHTTIWVNVLDIRDTYLWHGRLRCEEQFQTHTDTPIFENFSIQLDALLKPLSRPAESSELAYIWQASYSGYCIPPPTGPRDNQPMHYDRGIALETTMEHSVEGKPRSWTTGFWVPIPLSLFARAEHKTFICSAKVTVRDLDTDTTTEITAKREMVSIECLIHQRLLPGIPSQANAP